MLDGRRIEELAAEALGDKELTPEAEGQAVLDSSADAEADQTSLAEG